MEEQTQLLYDQYQFTTNRTFDNIFFAQKEYIFYFVVLVYNAGRYSVAWIFF